MEVSRRKAPPRPPYPAAPLPLIAYLLALAAPARGADEPVWRSEQAIGAIAASRADGVFVASGSCLDQLDYSLKNRLSRLYRDQAGNCTEPVSLAPPARPRPGSSFSKLLLPYREGATGLEGLLLTGWTFDRGACEVRPLGNLNRSSLRNGTEVVSCHPQGSTAGVVYRASGTDLWYLAVAATYVLPEPETANRCNPAASDRDTAIALKNTEGRSLATRELGRLKLRGSAGSLHFVDAFLWNGSVYFPYYPYNYTSGAATGWPSMARIAQSTEVLFQGQAALDCGHGHPDGRRLLLSSSLVEAVDIWAGVFSAATGEGQERRSPATTALCLFRMSEIQARARSCSWDFQATEHNCVSPAPGAQMETWVTFTKSQVHNTTDWPRLQATLKHSLGSPKGACRKGDGAAGRIGGRFKTLVAPLIPFSTNEGACLGLIFPTPPLLFPTASPDRSLRGHVDLTLWANRY